MMQDLASKTVLITGAAGLLGQHFATQLAKAGARVVLIDIQEMLFADHLLENDYHVYTFQADITKKEDWQKIQKYLDKNHIYCNVLINNACIKSDNFFNPFEDFPLEDWDCVMAVNVTGAMLACQTIGKQMAKRKEGSIINIASIYGMVAPDQRIYEGSEYLGKQINTPAVYSVSKAAILGLTKYLATYWGDRNVRVNAISPGGIYSGQNETFVDKYIAKVPLNRMGKPQDVVGAALYLSSDISSYMTGQNLIVDGGWTIW